MRKHRLALFCVLSVSLASAGAASAEPVSPVVTGTAPSVLDDVLRIWNQAPATDAGDDTPEAMDASQQWYNSNNSNNANDEDDATDDVTPSYTAPDGSALTPNLDRLLQGAGRPLMPSDGVRSGASQPATDAYGFTASPYFQKGNQNTHQPSHYTPPPPPRCPPPTPTPEPGSLMLFGAAAVSAAAARRRRRSGSGN